MGELTQAQKDGDVPKLKAMLQAAKLLPSVNKEWIAGAEKEIEEIEKKGGVRGKGKEVQVEEQGSSSSAASSSDKPDDSNSPLAHALKCKEVANAELKKGTKESWKAAAGTYGTGIHLLNAELSRQHQLNQQRAKEAEEEGGKAPPAEFDIRSNPSFQPHFTLLSQLHGNRAQAYLNLRDWSLCVDDCRKSLGLDPSNGKVFYRAAKASFHNGLLQQALTFIDAGLKTMQPPGSTESDKPADTKASDSKTDAKADTKTDTQPPNSDPTVLSLTALKKTVEIKLTEQNRKKEELSQLSPQDLLDSQQTCQRLYSQIQTLDQQIMMKKNRRRTQDLTRGYVTSVMAAAAGSGSSSATTTDPRFFIPCGRAFLQKDQGKLVAELDEMMTATDEEIPKMENARSELARRCEKAEAEFEALTKKMKLKG